MDEIMDLRLRCLELALRHGSSHAASAVANAATFADFVLGGCSSALSNHEESRKSLPAIRDAIENSRPAS